MLKRPDVCGRCWPQRQALHSVAHNEWIMLLLLLLKVCASHPTPPHSPTHLHTPCPSCAGTS